MSLSGRNKHYLNGLFLIFHHSKVQPIITQPSTHMYLLHPENLFSCTTIGFSYTVHAVQSSRKTKSCRILSTYIVKTKYPSAVLPIFTILLSSNVKNSGYDISSHLSIIIISIGSNFIETGWNVKTCSATI